MGHERASTPMSLPLVDDETGSIDRSRVLSEALPIAKLAALAVAAALVPAAVAHLLGEFSTLGELFALLTQFVLAVGLGVVLLYVVARGTQIAEE